MSGSQSSQLENTLAILRSRSGSVFDVDVVGVTEVQNGEDFLPPVSLAPIVRTSPAKEISSTRHLDSVSNLSVQNIEGQKHVNICVIGADLSASVSAESQIS